MPASRRLPFDPRPPKPLDCASKGVTALTRTDNINHDRICSTMDSFWDGRLHLTYSTPAFRDSSAIQIVATTHRVIRPPYLRDSRLTQFSRAPISSQAGSCRGLYREKATYNRNKNQPQYKTKLIASIVGFRLGGLEGGSCFTTSGDRFAGSPPRTRPEPRFLGFDIAHASSGSSIVTS